MALAFAGKAVGASLELHGGFGLRARLAVRFIDLADGWAGLFDGPVQGGDSGAVAPGDRRMRRAVRLLDLRAAIVVAGERPRQAQATRRVLPDRGRQRAGRTCPEQEFELGVGVLVEKQANEARPSKFSTALDREGRLCCPGQPFSCVT